jgi:hypothetical protein
MLEEERQTFPAICNVLRNRMCFQPIRIYVDENCTWAPFWKLVDESFNGRLI